MGADCSLNTTSDPILTFLAPEICNTVTEPCTSVVVYGKNMIDTPSLNCYFYKLQSKLSDFKVTGPAETSPKVTYITSSQVVCDVPEAGNYLITVSNSGPPEYVISNNTDSSNWLLFIGTDRSCFTCDPAEGTCVQR
ncbi:hypothetical protein EGW08_011567, partial [Elysia chlorotica]